MRKFGIHGCLRAGERVRVGAEGREDDRARLRPPRAVGLAGRRRHRHPAYHRASASGSRARQKMPPMPVTRSMEVDPRIRAMLSRDQVLHVARLAAIRN